MSGTRARTGSARLAQPARMQITEHQRAGSSVTWEHSVEEGESWTRHLLEPRQLGALAEARALPCIGALGEVASFEVSVVTGANDFFSVSSDTLEQFDLRRWARPLLPRIRHAEGLVYRAADQGRTDAEGARAWLLDFSDEQPQPERFAGARAYLSWGEEQRLHERYKCRIRAPWYRVPNLRRGSLMLSKRCHAFPRVVVNQAKVLTTDTIYRGRMLKGSTPLTARALAAAFHNSLTLLTAELEGRSFGGGVLELVPSEIRRLSVPLLPAAEQWLSKLDETLRRRSDEHLVADTDALLVASQAMPRRLLEELAEARAHMIGRRMDRSSLGVVDEQALDGPQAARDTYDAACDGRKVA